MHLTKDHIWTGISFCSTAIQSGKNYLLRNNQKVEQITYISCGQLCWKLKSNVYSGLSISECASFPVTFRSFISQAVLSVSLLPFTFPLLYSNSSTKTLKVIYQVRCTPRHLNQADVLGHHNPGKQETGYWCNRFECFRHIISSLKHRQHNMFWKVSIRMCTI